MVATNRCQGLVGLLADFVEGHLPRELHDELEGHFAACADCAAQVRTYRSTVSLLRSIRDEDLPAHLRCALKSVIQKNCRN